MKQASTSHEDASTRGDAKDRKNTKLGEADEDKKDEDAPALPEAPIKPIRIDLDGLMARAVALPVDAANISQLDVRGRSHLLPDAAARADRRHAQAARRARCASST